MIQPVQAAPDLLSSGYVQFGALGLCILTLITGLGVVWRRFTQVQDQQQEKFEKVLVAQQDKFASALEAQRKEFVDELHRRDAQAEATRARSEDTFRQVTREVVEAMRTSSERSRDQMISLQNVVETVLRKVKGKEDS